MTDAVQNQPIPESALPPDKGAEYAQEMLKKAEGAEAPADQQQPQDNTKEEQKLLAGKFKSAEELEKAYTELQKKLGEKKPEQPATQKKPATDPNLAIEKKDETQDATADAAKEAVENAGLDWDGLNSKWATNGALEDADYEALEKGGIPRHIVDQFIDGQVAAAKIARSEVTSVVGGDEKYGELISWAAENLPAEEIASFNKIATGRDLGAIKIAVAGLKARYEAQAGSEPNLIGGDTSAGNTGYKTQAEMKADMAKPEYHKDPAFRAKVIAKLRATTAF